MMSFQSLKLAQCTDVRTLLAKDGFNVALSVQDVDASLLQLHGAHVDSQRRTCLDGPKSIVSVCTVVQLDPRPTRYASIDHVSYVFFFRITIATVFP